MTDKFKDKVAELIEVDKELMKQIRELKELMTRNNKDGYVV